jgi:F-type H+-transporting ATPase subunit a
VSILSVVNVLASKEFPPLDHLVEWRPFGGSFEPLHFNKIALINVAAALIIIVLFLIAGMQKGLVPRGVRNVVESTVGFIDKGIAQEVMGHGSHKWVPFLTSIFVFIFFNNIFGIIPGIQMPATARMAVPLILALLVWVVFNVAGVIANGPKYFTGVLFPPGVPKALYILVTPIEFMSVFLIRPFSLAVRLFANVLAGHILLATFAWLTQQLFLYQGIDKDQFFFVPVAILPFLMLVLMTAFELGVAFLQAYIFTILSAVYIGGALHPEH